MADKPKLTVSITPDDQAWLKAESKRLQISEGELIRRILAERRGV
jgi:hypothetical protein